MEIIKSEMRTTHQVRFTLDELNSLLSKPTVYTDEPRELTKAGGYGLLMSLTGNQASEIAHQLGFQKWDHIGIYNEKRKEYTITFSDDGNTMDRREI